MNFRIKDPICSWHLLQSWKSVFIRPKHRHTTRKTTLPCLREWNIDFLKQVLNFNTIIDAYYLNEDMESAGFTLFKEMS